MKVYYSGNFWGHTKAEHAGKEVSLNKEFLWGGLKWYIPAVYSCSKGLVIDFCVEITRDKIEDFLKHWVNDKKMSGLSDEELEQLERENPFSLEIDVVASINDKELGPPRMCAVCWHPCEVEREQIEDVQEELMENYACDRNHGWRFIRACFPWRTARKPKIKTLALTLRERPVAYAGIHFTTEAPCDKQKIICTHPVSKQKYNIAIYECATKTLPDTPLQFNRNVQLPNYFNMLTYSISPELPQEEFGIQDCARGDKPRSLRGSSSAANDISSGGVFVIGGADGPSATFVAGKKTEEQNKRAACSSLHFAPVPKVEWRTKFYVKENEDFYMKISLEKS